MDNRVGWCSAGQTDVGKLRSSNQDALLLDDNRGVWVIADGMGGRAGGEVASRVAVQSVHHFLCELSPSDIPLASTFDATTIMSHVRSALQHADKAIRAAAQSQPELQGLGTTVVATVVSSLSPLTVTIAHVGDSRAYLFRNHVLHALTRDHSLVEELLIKGLISPADAASHPQRHVLLRALGIEGQTEPDIFSQPVQAHDLLLLCTDGITKMLSETNIAECLGKAPHLPDKACELVIAEANAHGGKDNSTAVVVCFM